MNYASGTWKLTKEHGRMIQWTQKKCSGDVSFENNTDDEIDAAEIEDGYWIEDIKRSTNDAMEKMGKCEDSMLEQDSQKMKWTLAFRTATSPSERWLMKAAEWNPELSSKIQDQQSDWETKKNMGR